VFLKIVMSFVVFFCLHLSAIAEGRGLAKGEIGLTCLDFKGSEMVLSQVSGI